MNILQSTLKRVRYGGAAALFTAAQAFALLAPFIVTERADAVDTGFQSPTATTTPNEWSSPSNAFSSNNSYATADDDNDDQGYSSFGFSVPSGSSINGIEVTAEAFASSSAGTSIYSTSFGTGENENGVGTGWTENGGNSSTDGTIAKQATTGVNSASPNGGRFALIEGEGGYICRTVSTEGYASPQLSYYWRGDNDAEDGEAGVVEYRLANTGNCGNGTWTGAASHELDDGNTGVTAWSSLQSVNLPAGSNLFIRFRTVSSNADESFRIDGVSVSGTPTVSAELQARISGNGGSSFTDRQTVNLTGVETVHAFGSPSSLWGSSWNSDSFSNGNFRLEIRLNNPANGVTASLDHVQVKVHYAAPVEPATNPRLGQSCGLDVALVLDVSSSIDSTELGQMRTAMQSFVTVFTGTPTEFSITKFATTGEVVSGFTDDLGQVNTALGSVDGSGYTNWEDGLAKASSTFSGDRPGVPNMVIFASDGNPNTIGDGPANNASPDGSVAAMNPAITVANTLKTNEGAHILALGIGDNLSTSNLEKISGPGDVISSDFDTLATTLADLAQQLCGGTINVNKLIDDDNNPGTPAVAGGSGWEFKVDGETKTTDADGQVVPFEVDAGTYDVKENQVKDGYVLVSGVCKDAAGANKGQFNSNTQSVEGVEVSNTDIITCEFVNRPAKGKITLIKQVVGGDATSNQFGLTIGGTPVDSGQALELPVGEYAINEDADGPDGNYSFTSITGDGCPAQLGGKVVLTDGQNVVCTITNTLNLSLVNFIKYVVEPGQSAQQSANWLFTVHDGDTEVVDVQSGDSESLMAGSYTVTEEGINGVNAALYVLSAASGSCSLNQGVVTLLVAAGDDNQTCEITNTRKTGTLIVKKNVINDNGGKRDYKDFTFRVNGGDAQNFDADNSDPKGEDGKVVLTVPTGWYTVTEPEADKYGYETNYHGCKTYVGYNEVKYCKITNDDKPGKIVIHKEVINNNGGDKKAKDFRFKVDYGKWQNFNYSGTNYVYVDAGWHSVHEDEKDSYRASYEGCKHIYVKNGETKHCYITNNDKAPEVKVVKITDPAWDSQDFRFFMKNNGNLYDSFKLDGHPYDDYVSNVYKTGHDLKEGWVYVYEKDVDGWDHVWTKCFKETRYGLHYVGHPFKAEIGKEYVCKVFNKQRGGVIVTKFNDVNRNGSMDEGEEVLPDWTMTLSGEKDCELEVTDTLLTAILSYEEQEGCDESHAQMSEVTDVNGQAVFNNLKPGKYVVGEELQDGWVQSGVYCDYDRKAETSLQLRTREGADSSGRLYLRPGETVYCYVGNYQPMVDLTVTPICKNNFPYLQWRIRTTNVVPEPTQFTMDWYTVDGNNAGDAAGQLSHTQVIPVSDTTFDAVTSTYSGEVLWPGADTAAPDWPGWTLVNGVWTIDPSDFGGNLVPEALVKLTVNPTDSATAEYPGEGGTCVPSNPQVLGERTLVDTGSEVLAQVIVSLGLLTITVIVATKRPSSYKLEK